MSARREGIVFRLPRAATREEVIPFWRVVEGAHFIERWESGRFDNRKFMGRAGSFWESETEKPEREWTPPILEKGVNTLEKPPWNNAIHLRNSQDGKTVDRVFFAVRQAFKRAKMRVDAKIPNPTNLRDGAHLFIGFEVIFAGGYAVACLHCYRGEAELLITYMGDTGITSTEQAVTINNPDVFAVYFLEIDPPYLRLYQQAPNLGNMTLTNTVKAPEDAHLTDLYVPFFSNESTYVVSDFYIGQFEVWRTELPDISDRYSPLEQLFPNGVITLEFDDGRLDTYENAFPVLREKGMKATIAVITNLLATGGNWEGYPTIDWGQLRNGYQYEGFEIASHTRSHSHLTTLSDSQLDDELRGSLEDLRSQNFDPQGVICPYSDWNEHIIEHAKQYYRYMGAVLDKPMLLARVDPYRIGIISMCENLSQTEFEAILNRTRKYKHWTVLLSHGVFPDTVDPGREPWDISLSKLTQFLDLIKLKKIPVMTHSEVLSRIESVMGLPKNVPPLWSENVTGTTTNSWNFGLDWYCQRYRHKTVEITNTHATNTMQAQIFLIPAVGGYGFPVVPPVTIQPNDHFMYETDKAVFNLQIQVKDYINGKHATYRIDYCGRVRED